MVVIRHHGALPGCNLFSRPSLGVLGLYEPLSKLLVSPLISPIVLPYIIPYILPFREFRQLLLWPLDFMFSAREASGLRAQSLEIAGLKKSVKYSDYLLLVLLLLLILTYIYILYVTIAIMILIAVIVLLFSDVCSCACFHPSGCLTVEPHTHCVHDDC